MSLRCFNLFQEAEDGVMEAFDDADPGVFYEIQRKVAAARMGFATPCCKTTAQGEFRHTLLQDCKTLSCRRQSCVGKAMIWVHASAHCHVVHNVRVGWRARDQQQLGLPLL
jgi:hypothetical protein